MKTFIGQYTSRYHFVSYFRATCGISLREKKPSPTRDHDIRREIMQCGATLEEEQIDEDVKSIKKWKAVYIKVFL
jgi:hypothetical protein